MPPSGLHALELVHENCVVPLTSATQHTCPTAQVGPPEPHSGPCDAPTEPLLPDCDAVFDVLLPDGDALVVLVTEPVTLLFELAAPLIEPA